MHVCTCVHAHVCTVADITTEVTCTVQVANKLVNVLKAIHLPTEASPPMRRRAGCYNNILLGHHVSVSILHINTLPTEVIQSCGC